MARKRHVRFNAFLGLSAEGQNVVLRGIDEDWTQKQIQQRLEEATGEKIANGSLSRFVVYWRTKRDEERAAQTHVNRIVTAVKKGNVDAIDAAETLLNQAVVELIHEGGAQMEAETVLRLNRQSAEYRLREKQIDLKQDELELAKRQAEIAERRLQAKEKQLKAVRHKAKQTQTKLARRTDLPADVKRDIRSTYGLASQEKDAA